MKTLTCPECGGTMVLKPSRFGGFYGCQNYPLCTCTHGAHPNGEPLGVPANKETKLARIAAHDEFDKLWRDGGMRRKEAYRVLQSLMGLTPEEAHIGRFTAEQCRTLVERLKAQVTT